jgi:hypothetical protein
VKLPTSKTGPHAPVRKPHVTADASCCDEITARLEPAGRIRFDVSFKTLRGSNRARKSSLLMMQVVCFVRPRCLWLTVLVSAWGCAKAVVANGEGSGEGPPVGGTPGAGAGRGGAGFKLPDAGALLPPPQIEVCASESRVPERTPVDLLFVIDASSSMLELVEGGTQTKWQLAQEAMLAFMRDSESAGLDVGLTLFPVRGICTSDRPVCLGPNNPPGPLPDCPCPGDLTCILAGRCAVSGEECTNVGGPCGTGPAENRCVIKHHCPGLDASCAGADYSALAVPFGLLPGNLPPVMAALAATDPVRNSGTPTGVAVSAALDVLQTRYVRSGGRPAGLVLVTDGEPTKCLPGDPPAGPGRAAAIATAVVGPVASSRQATPRISVFAVGVFSQRDITLGYSKVVTDVAAAGGTKPFVVVANGNLTRELQETFNQIRNLTVSCEYQIPLPANGTVDFGKVNVHVQAVAKDDDLPYVAIASRCDPAQGGWYYDDDPAVGGKPTRVLLCPSSCELLEEDPRSKVELRFGCKTRIVD